MPFRALRVFEECRYANTFLRGLVRGAASGMQNKSFIGKKIQTGIDQKQVNKGPEVHVNLDPGQILFAQGDVGGHLYFVESGNIEIFINKKGQDISLAEMGPGEIIGVMTLLTSEPRLASARAKESSVVKKIGRSHIVKLIATFPKWLNIVLKEFTLRINEMNRRYSETLLELKQVRETQITPLFLATQMAQGLVIVGRGIAKSQGGQDIVFVDELLEKFELVLNQKRDVIASIWRVFSDAGLVKIEIEPERKRKIVPLERLDGVSVFTQFVRESGQGPNRKILRARFNFNELLTMTSLVKFAFSQGASPDKSSSFKIADIESRFETLTGVPWDASHLEKPVKLGLLVCKGEGAEMMLTFTPAALGRTMGCVVAMKTLAGDHGGDVPPEASSGPEEKDAETLKKAS